MTNSSETKEKVVRTYEDLTTEQKIMISECKFHVIQDLAREFEHEEEWETCPYGFGYLLKNVAFTDVQYVEK